MTEVQKNREEIKSYLSLLYDNWWYNRGEGKYFDLQIPRIKKSIEIILNTAYLRITERGKKILRDFRNIDEHSFPLGIDCLTYPFSRGKPNFRLDEKYGRLFTVGDRTGENYTYYGLPDIKFNELEPILKILAVNAKKIIQGRAIIRVLVQSY